MKITSPYSNLTKKESENMERMRIFRNYEKLMENAKSFKEDFLSCKAQNSSNLDEKNRIALSQLTTTFREYALKNWNEAQDLRREYDFLNKMIEIKK